ncbi:Single-stranded DNA-binding protein ssb [compost metagenome]
MLNSVVLVGRVGQDPDIKFFETGRVKTTFSLAVNRPTKDRETDWFRIELWGKQAEVARDYVRKGSLIGIEGRLEFSRWTDAQGQKHEMPIIAASNLRLLGSKGDNQAAGMGSDGGYGDVGF